MKKLTAVVDGNGDGTYEVTVTNVDDGAVTVLTISAASEKDAAFKAMEQVNGN